MPKRVVSLTDMAVRNAKSKATEYKIFDGGGLYLSVTPSGGKLWRLKYRFEDKERFHKVSSLHKYLPFQR